MPTSLLWLAACTPAVDEPVRAPIPPLVSDGPMLTAVVTRAPVPVPARFTAPPDRWIADPPPLGKVRQAMCADVPGVREAVLAALRSGAEDPDLQQHQRSLFDAACATPEWCSWVSASLRVPGHAGNGGLWRATLECPGPEVDQLVAADAQAWVLIERTARTGIFHPRLETIAGKTLARSGEVDIVLHALAAIDDPAAEEALLRLHRDVPRAQGDEVALSLWGRSSPAAVALFEEVCARTEDERCQLSRSDPVSTLAGVVEAGEDPTPLFARYPNYRTALLGALTSCVVDGIDPRPCLIALARQDRAAAATLAAGVEDPSLADLAKVLGEPDRAKVVAALEGLGFPPLAVPANADPITVPEILAAAGHTVALNDPMADPRPLNEELLYTLASVAGLDWEFDELPPTEAPLVDGRTAAITLYAWAGGWRYRTLTAPTLGWDPWTDVGLLNQVAIAVGSESRFALVDDETHVIVAAAATLTALEDQGWVQFVRVPEGYMVTPIAGDPVVLEPEE